MFALQEHLKEEKAVYQSRLVNIKLVNGSFAKGFFVWLVFVGFVAWFFLLFYLHLKENFIAN